MFQLEEFRAQWAVAFGDTPPLPHLLREKFSDRWLRVYTLPDQRRQPNTDDEVLKIKADIVKILRSSGYRDGSVWLVISTYSPHDCRASSIKSVGTFNVEVDDNFNDKLNWRVIVSQDVVDDDIYNELINISLYNFRGQVLIFFDNVVVAPYDGGIDIIWTLVVPNVQA